MLRSLFEWVDVLPSSIAMRESLNGYPLALTAHVVSMALVAGIVIYWDMRLAGIALKRVPVSKIEDGLLLSSWAVIGVLLSVGSGLFMVYSQPMRYYGNFYFWIKNIFLLLAAVNAIYFHQTIGKSMSSWEHNPVTPFKARMAGLASLALWAGIIATGRMIAYSGLVPQWWINLGLGT
jgi:hypothetical protein